MYAYTSSYGYFPVTSFSWVFRSVDAAVTLALSAQIASTEVRVKCTYREINNLFLDTNIIITQT